MSFAVDFNTQEEHDLIHSENGVSSKAPQTTREATYLAFLHLREKYGCKELRRKAAEYGLDIDPCDIENLR